MTEPRRAARHAAAHSSAPPAPDGIAPDEVWVPPAYEPPQPGDFVEYASAAFEVRRRRGGTTVLVCLLLIAGLAFGGWWYLQHDRGTADPVPPTCHDARQQIEAGFGDHLKVTDGGQVPAGFPLPGASPARVCTLVSARGTVIAGIWRHASEKDYAALLTAGGWAVTTTLSNGITLHVNGADHRRVATGTFDGMLVVAYQR